jgi:hypothetical protein
LCVAHLDGDVNRNVGSTDGRARIAASALLGVLALGTLAGAVPLPTVLAPLLGVFSVVGLVTGATGFCGLYALVGYDTCDARTAR